jgi:predicted transcriptional regulator
MSPSFSYLAAGLPNAPTGIAPITPPDSGLFDVGLVVGLGLAGLGVSALLGLLYYFGVGGLRQIDSKNVLNHPLRQALLQTVQEDPGAHLRDLAARHHTAVTNTQWHLRKLEMANLVKTQKVQGKRVYYPVQGGVATKERAIQNAALRNPNAEAVRAFIAANPGTEPAAIANALHLNPGTVRWHLRRLEEARLLRVIPEGPSQHYYAMTPNRPDRPPRPVRVAEEIEQKVG